MVEKTYYVGQFTVESALAGIYFLGINRSGEGTLPFEQEEMTNNRVKNELSGRHLGSFDVLQGYLTAVVGELQFEGAGNVAFQVRTKNWGREAAGLFGKYLVSLNLPRILPLSSHQVKDLSSIVGLNLERGQEEGLVLTPGYYSRENWGG